MEKESILSEETIHILRLKFSKLSFPKFLIFLALLSTRNLCVCVLSGYSSPPPPNFSLPNAPYMTSFTIFHF